MIWNKSTPQATDNNNNHPSQIYSENLVTSRRATLSSDFRPMLMGSRTLPTLVSSEDSTIELNRSNRELNSFSEVDIQTRFMGFFSRSYPIQDKLKIAISVAQATTRLADIHLELDKQLDEPCLYLLSIF